MNAAILRAGLERPRSWSGSGYRSWSGSRFGSWSESRSGSGSRFRFRSWVGAESRPIVRSG